MIHKKLLAVILSLALVLTTFSGMLFSVSAVETEERDVYYSDLFFGYSYYLENSPILESYVENSSNIFDKVYYEFAESGTYKWSFAKETVDIAASPKDLVRTILDAVGLTEYTYENMLDNANKEFAKHIYGGFENADAAGMLNKCMEPIKKVAEIYDECADNTELILMDDRAALGEMAQLLLASGTVNRISATKIGELNGLIVENKNKITDMIGKSADIIEIWSVLATALVMENVRMELVSDICNNAPNGMLKDGMNRLYNQLNNNFVDYFWDNYMGKELFGKLGGYIVGKLTPEAFASNVSAATLVLGVMSVVSTVVFAIFDIPELDDLLTQNALRHYVTDLYSALSSKVTVFSQGINLNAPSQYMDMLNALVCATRSATEASEKIALSSNCAALETFKRLYHELDVASAVMNQAVDTVKKTPAEDLVKYSYGDMVVGDSVKASFLCSGSNFIEPDTVYTPWDGLNANVIVPVDYTLTIPENTSPVINGYLKCSKSRNRGGAYVYNYGDLTVTGYFTAESSRSTATAGMINYNVFRVGGKLGLGYNGSYTANGGSVTYVGGEMSIGANFAKDSTLYYGRDLIQTGNFAKSFSGHIILNGTRKQTISNVNWPKVTILNSSDEGVEFKYLTVSTFFNHNGNNFTAASSCSFPDYDGDGIKDNKDTSPLVGNPCVITVTTPNTECGTVSADRIETMGGTQHTVTATPTYKYEFVKWTNSAGTSVSTTAEYSFVAKTNDTLTAVFKKRSQPITTSTSGGSINAPTSAVIESTVNVSVTEKEGYVYTEGSLCYNGNKTNNGSFVMPDEAVTLTAEFVRNENYFALKEKIAEAKAYTYENYSAATFGDLQNAINNAESTLFNNVSAEVANEHIAALQNAEANLTDKFITEIAATNIPKLYLGVEELIYNTEITVYYDNGTTETTTAFTVDNFDCSVLGTQTVTFNYGIASCMANITVIKRNISHIEAEDIPDQIYVNGNTYFEPQISATYPLTGEELILGTDYTLTYSNNSAVGTATVTVTGMGRYDGETALSFNIYCDHSEGFSADGICTECACYQEPATDSEGYYLISNAGNLFWFAEKVNSGTGGINGRLINDLDVTEFNFVKVGTSTKKYSGTFDGGRHTLTYNITGSDHCAPFAYVSGATIKNLNVAGVINASGRNAASIVAEVPQAERLTLENCFSSVTINSILSGDGTHGGLIGAVMYYGNVSVTNCAFVGAIYGAETANCGGIVGWSNAMALNITNTFVAAEFSTIFDDCNTFVRNAGKLTLTNCYYLNEYNATPSVATQMTAEQFANGEVRDLLNNGTTVWGQKIGVTPYPIICNHPSYSNGVCELCGEYGAPPINNGYYEISIPEHLFGFAELVNSGNNTINGKLMKDLDVSEFNFVKIGTSEYPFKGTFDGNGHTLTFVINDTTYAAPFARVAGCTIKNLHTKGTINASDKYAGGIIGDVVSDTAVVENCISGVQINSTLSGDGTHGGLIGVATSAASIKNCGFYGSINGSGTNSCGGIMGWSNGTSTITNSYVAAVFNISATNGNTFARNKVSLNNCYYLTALNSTPSGAIQMTAEQFANGEVCTALNNGGNAWMQVIGVNKYPVFSNADSGTNACGDLNGDSLINSSDLIALKQYLIFNNGSYNMDYDINRDTYIDLRDLVRIKRILAGL